MSAGSITRRALLAGLTAVIVILVGATAAQAAPEPTKFLFNRHIGWEVNKATLGNVCSLSEECQPAKESHEPAEPGGFAFPGGVAVSKETGNVYVADKLNRRIQELTPEGRFVSMFGWEVNRTKVEAKASQAEQNVCTAASKDVCQAGVSGDLPGQLHYLKSLAVDPVGGAVWVAEGNEASGVPTERVQKFTATGQWVLEIGKGVNETTKGNLCTHEEEVKEARKCAAPAAEPGSEPGQFNFEVESSSLLAVGGPEDLLYVGDEGRVQKFKATGQSAGEIPLTAFPSSSKATAVAVNPAGELFVVEEHAGGIHIYNAKGELQPTVIDAAGGPLAVAIDTLGRPVLIEGSHGLLYTTTGVKLSQFAQPSGEMGAPQALAFGPSGELYVADGGTQEVEAYTPAVYPLAATCSASEVAATSARLCGEVNPNEMPTIGLFDYGTTKGSLNTPSVFSGEGGAFVPITAAVAGLVPNQTYYFKTVAEGKFGGETRVSAGEELSFQTPIIAPQILGEPTASFITGETAVLDGALNPEHTNTTYRFEYAPCPALPCPQATTTTSQESPQNGELPVAQEAKGLAADTTYRYRLLAENETHQAATGPEQAFTTAPAASVTASTGPASAVTATSAVVTGTVNPDGERASYTFEFGVWEGAATQYGIVQSASTGAGSTPLEEALLLTGLQPGTTYAYRIAITSGHSHATGTAALFMTQGLPSLLIPPGVSPLLAIPNIAFPQPATAPKTTVRKAPTRAQKLAAALKACAKKPKQQRPSCRKQARKRYGKAS